MAYGGNGLDACQNRLEAQRPAEHAKLDGLVVAEVQRLVSAAILVFCDLFAFVARRVAVFDAVDA